MHIIINNNTFTIRDELLVPQTLLHTMLLTKHNNIEKLEEAYVLHEIDPIGFQSYIDFLNFSTDFFWDEHVAELFDYMGHINTLSYPLDFWKIKLIDDRVRDFFYVAPQHQLIKLDADPERVELVLFHLIDEQLPNDHYIAGGAAAYIAGITDKYNDIDIFSCNRQASESYINEIIAEKSNEEHGGTLFVVYSNHAVTYSGDRMKVQLILREYASPSEIVHGFDIASCAIIFDGKDVWTTVKGKYCIDNKVNWFEPDRSSPTYATRLAKYHTRGFNIMLPMTYGLSINTKLVERLEKDTLDLYYSIIRDPEARHKADHDNILIDVEDLAKTCNERIDEQYLKRYRFNTILDNLSHPEIDYQRLANHLEENNNQGCNIQNSPNYVSYIDQINEFMAMQKPKILYGQIRGLFHGTNIKDICDRYAMLHCNNNPNANVAALAIKQLTIDSDNIQTSLIPHYTLYPYKLKDGREVAKNRAKQIKYLFSLFPTDPVSIIVLTAVLGYSPFLLPSNIQMEKSDYAPNQPSELKNIKQLTWKTHAPMEQLTGTFYPEPIMEDVIQFYLSSSLIIRDDASTGVMIKPYYNIK